MLGAREGREDLLSDMSQKRDLLKGKSLSCYVQLKICFNGENTFSNKNSDVLYLMREPVVPVKSTSSSYRRSQFKQITTKIEKLKPSFCLST